VDDFQRRMRLEQLFAAHAGAVRAYARRRIDPVSADDTVSEVFAIAWRRLDDVPEVSLPWLLGCARRVLAHQRRRLHRDVALAERLGRAPAQPAPRDDPVLGWALSQLNERDRELLLLIAWEGLDPAQAAQVLGCTRNALAVRLHRARKRLAAVLRRRQGPQGSNSGGLMAEEALR
jgi:RNA polymerase sigma-70 factor (ECF subfamily)